MILHRCFRRNRKARHDEPGGPLWFPTARQGEGRHDNPAVYGCLYVSERAVASVAEQLSRFASHASLEAWLLTRERLPLALADIQLDDEAELLDLDDPSVLLREELRPSMVATRRREITQPQALRLYRRHPQASGLRWWSRLESLWMNVTLFDRAAPRLRLVEVRELIIDDPAVVEAAELLGLAA